jgi:subtilisin family serine protease
MNRSPSSILVLVAVAVSGIQGCDHARAPTDVAAGQALTSNTITSEKSGRHIVLFAAERVPSDFGFRVASLGGSIEASLDQVGVAVLTGLTEGAAAELAGYAGIQGVEPDPITKMMGEAAPASDLVLEPVASDAIALADATASPATATFYPRQWNLRAVFADQAWAAGHFGSPGVLVAILDTGIDYLHPDLEGLVDLTRSTSMVPEDVTVHYPGQLPFSDLHNHGTFVASIVASNARTVAGVNRYVTLLAVKIADSANASSAGRMLSGIIYAADQGADVINISNGVQRDKTESPGTVAAFERAANYVFRKGSLLVSLPFNDRADLDHNGNLVRFPCEAANAICVAATGPTGQPQGAGPDGPWDNVDARAPYSAFGRSAVDLAAPGGTGMPTSPLFTKVWLPCTTTPTRTTARPECRASATYNPSACRADINRCAVAQSVGTSFATPHVAGLAALLVAQLGHGNPALIRARILQSADDLGEPGTDPYYGKGRINIARALGVAE